MDGGAMRTHLGWISALALAAGCSGGGGSGGGGGGNVPLPNSVTYFGGTLNESVDQTFDFAAGDLSAVIYAETQPYGDANQYAFISRVVDPNGNLLTQAGALGADVAAYQKHPAPLRPFFLSGSGGFQIPEADGYVPPVGTWTFRVAGTTPSANVVI